MRLLPFAILLISLLIGACFAQLDDDKFDSDFDSDWFWIGSNLRSISKSTKCIIHIFTDHLNIITLEYVNYTYLTSNFRPSKI